MYSRIQKYRQKISNHNVILSNLQCDNEPQDTPYPGVCPEVNRKCIDWFANDNYPTNKSRKYCDEWVPCSNCKSVRYIEL